MKKYSLNYHSFIISKIFADTILKCMSIYLYNFYRKLELYVP